MTSSARDPAEQVVDPGVGELAAEFSLVRRRSGYEKVEDGDRRAREGYMDLKEVPLPDDVQALTSARCHLCATSAPRWSNGVRANRIRYEVFGPDLWAARIPE